MIRFNPKTLKLGRHEIRLNSDAADRTRHTIEIRGDSSALKFWDACIQASHLVNFGHIENQLSVLLLDGGDRTVKVSGATVVTDDDGESVYIFPVNFFRKEKLKVST